uniref:Protease inhibitor/seed storage/LTP family protein n=1 Tax=Oryza sativa subsp. japonica TaxID=39947 RepID=Q7G4M5_ORYSJ|nr:Protease inhibitor/seed storage/LTP family protein [Oryza sativa Japonica Group]
MARIVLVVAFAAVVVVQAAMAQRPGMPPAVVPPSLPTTTPPAPTVVAPPLPTTPPPAVVAPSPPLPPLTPPPAIVPPALPPPPPLPAIVVPPALPPTPAIAVPPALPPIPAIVPPSLPPTPEANLPCVAELAPCSEFYRNATAKPTGACCAPLKKAYESELGCLCSVLTNPAMAATVGVDTKKGLDLFGRCDVKVPADVCSSHAPAPVRVYNFVKYRSFGSLKFGKVLLQPAVLPQRLPQIFTLSPPTDAKEAAQPLPPCCMNDVAACRSPIASPSPMAGAPYQCTIATYPLSWSLISLRLSSVKRQERYSSRVLNCSILNHSFPDFLNFLHSGLVLHAFILMSKNMIWYSINVDPY